MTTEGLHFPQKDGTLLRIKKGAKAFLFPGLILDITCFVYFEETDSVSIFEWEFLKRGKPGTLHLQHRVTAQAMYDRMVNDGKDMNDLLDRLESAQGADSKLLLPTVQSLFHGIQNDRPLSYEMYQAMMLFAQDLENRNIDQKQLIRKIVVNYWGKQKLNAKAAMSIVQEKRDNDSSPPKTAEQIAELDEFLSKQDNLEELRSASYATIVLEVLAWISTKENRRVVRFNDIVEGLKKYRPELAAAVENDEQTIRNNVQIGLDKLLQEKSITMEGPNVLITDDTLQLAVGITALKEGV